jgi:hypothetical protein
MSDLFTILKKLQAKPGLYIGHPSVGNLFMFLAGYKAAKLEMGVKPTPEELNFYREFQPWLQEKFSISTSKSWAKIIQFYSKDEQEAFDRFFELLSEFTTSNVGQHALVASSPG